MTNRYICNIFDEMRKAYDTRNFSYLPGLIEEAQVAANRMEASLYDKHDYNRLRDRIKEAKETLKKVKKEANIPEKSGSEEFIEELDKITGDFTD